MDKLTEKVKLYNDDCLNVLPHIPDKSVDMVLCDPPYDTTKNGWDRMLPLNELWKCYERIVKNNGAIVLFSQMPFSAKLVCSNIKYFKYEWIWNKPMATGFLNSKFAPMRCHENILIFSKGAASYVKDKSKTMAYNPQMELGKPYKVISSTQSKNYDYKNMKLTESASNGTRYPRDIITFKHDKNKFHPTQKPVPLLEYLIKTYTNEGETVLDNCMGSGSTGVACLNTGRNFIGIEIEKEYFDIAEKRILQPRLI